ncbi:peptidase C13 family-domain-containing protein [Apiospora marii]|uniref:Peptidase C13 family-domain-containing protein n=1 Tax=Apiospora marii TaxID=335849 RepID=A0ABR1SH33_9PEZI
MSLPFVAFDEFIRSRVITFVVGSSPTEIHVHADAISRLSKPLKVLIDGDMKEAREGRVVWDDIDSDTFARFAQWAYTHDYKTPEPTVPPDVSPPSTKADAGNDSPNQSEKALYNIKHKTDTARCASCSGAPDSRPFEGTHNCTCTKCNRSCLPYLCHECDQPVPLAACDDCRVKKSKSGAMIRAFTDTEEWTLPSGCFNPRRNIKAEEDYTNVLLSHAKLYVLADKYDIAGLGDESIHRLYVTLRSFAVYKSRMVDIVSLVQFVFDNTQDGDRIRSMLALYCACIAEDLAECIEFESLMQASPDFGRALVLKMSKRLD